MNIQQFIKKYNNHPVLFIGTGISLRYLENAYTWDGLLSYISTELTENDESYLDLKSSCEVNGKYKLEKIAEILESHFNEKVKKERNGKFKKTNDFFYDQMKLDKNHSRFKIFISSLLSDLNFNPEMESEIAEFKKTRKNIGSIITTNYDNLIEEIFEFNPLIGNDILLSNPYGSVYKIHGCVSEPDKIIIVEEDYNKFDEKYELVRAQLLSLFIHNPIIFLGYNIGDDNIKKILKTIFTYIEPNSTLANKIRDNFLLVEYEKGSTNEEVCEHDIDMDGFSTIRINKIKTDNYNIIYESLSNLHLPISAMDVRKVQSIVKEIYSGGSIKVSITEDLDNLNNEDKIIAIGSSKSISYQYHTSAEMIANYFTILDESNAQILELVDKYKIQNQQYFPIFGFLKINPKILSGEKLDKIQRTNIKTTLKNTPVSCKTCHNKIEDVFGDNKISKTNEIYSILWNLMEENINLDEIEKYLRNFKLTLSRYKF
jgi:hypothetical protein